MFTQNKGDLMEISIPQSKIIKTIAILMMLCLHLFNRPYESLFSPTLFIGAKPLSYYISLFSDACVPIFLFISGYGLYFNYQKNKVTMVKSNSMRLFKLYINYWIIVVLFAVLLGIFLGKEGYPGSFIKFALNFLGLDNSYNGAWWFFFTYILLTLLAPLLFKVLEFSKTWLLLILVLLFYFVSIYFRIYNSNQFINIYLAWVFKQFYLFGTSLFPFIVGAIVLQKKWHSKFSNRFAGLKYKSVVALFGIVALIVIHGLIPNFVIAPFWQFLLFFYGIRLCWVNIWSVSSFGSVTTLPMFG